MTTDLALVHRALLFAAEKHKNQRRLDRKTPYINHPIAVLSILTCEASIPDSEVAAAGLLHDTLEDTETTVEELTDLFGETIARVVLEVSDDKSLPSMERKRLQIVGASHLSHAARLVRLADKISNLRDIHSAPPAQWSHARVREYFVWAGKVCDGICDTHPVLGSLFREAVSRAPSSEDKA